VLTAPGVSFLVAGEGFARVGATIDPESTPKRPHTNFGETVTSC